MISAPGWLTSHTKTPYPFVGPGTPEELEDTDFRTLFIDSYFRYTLQVPYGQQGARDEHLQLVRFDYNGYPLSSSSESSETSEQSSSSMTTEPEFQVVLRWAGAENLLNTANPGNGQLVFDYEVWGDWVVLEWTYLRDIDDADDYDKVVRLILDHRKLDDFDYPLLPAAAYFVPGTVEHSSSKVTTLRFINHSGNEDVLPDPDLVSPVADLSVIAGYNTTLELADPVVDPFQTATPVRAESRVTLDFEPGAGAGRYPGCEDPEVLLRRLNAQGPDDNGHFLFGTKGCYWLERITATAIACLPGSSSVTVLEDGVLVTSSSSSSLSPEPPVIYEDGVKGAYMKFHNWCDACCECDDYVDAYEKLSAVAALLESANTLYASVKAAVAADLANFISICASSGTLAYVISYMKPGWRHTVQGIVYNGTGSDKTNASLTLVITGAAGFNGTPGSFWMITGNDERVRKSDSVYTATYTGIIAAGTMVVFEYEVYYLAGYGRGIGGGVTMTLNGTLGSTSFGPIVETDNIKGPRNIEPPP